MVRLSFGWRCVLVALAAAMTVTVFTGFDRLAGEVEEITPIVREHAPEVALPLDRVTLIADGVRYEYTDTIATVDDLLTVAGVTLSGYDVVRPSLGTSLDGGEEVVVLRATEQTVVITEEIPYDMEMIPNEYIPRGTENVITEGAAGERVVTYTVVSVAGEEVARSAARIEVTREPITAVVEYGPGGVIVTDSGEEIHWSYKIDGNATAYTTEGMRVKNNASGKTARPGTVAVDPKVIPLGTELYIRSRDDIGVKWDYGECVAEDTGGAVKGNVVDLYFSTFNECYKFGRRYCTIYVVEQ